MINLFCRICGYEHSEPQWGEDNQSPIYDFCPCCGVESGNEDYTIDSIKQYRKSWIENGSIWKNPKSKPNSWSLEAQLEHIPSEFG